MKIITKRIDEMERATYNPRIDLMPEDEEFQYLEESMRRFGQVLPVVWNQRTNRVVSGHQRLSVLEYWGEEKAEVSVVDLDETKEKQLPFAAGEQDHLIDDESLLVGVVDLAQALQLFGGDHIERRIGVQAVYIMVLVAWGCAVAGSVAVSFWCPFCGRFSFGNVTIPRRFIW